MTAATSSGRKTIFAKLPPGYIELLLGVLLLTAGGSLAAHHFQAGTNPPAEEGGDPQRPPAQPGKPPQRVDRFGDKLPEPAVQRLGTIRFHGGMLVALAVSPDSTMVATAGTSSTVYLWDLATGRLLQQFDLKGGLGAVLMFSPDNKLLYTQSHAVQAWDIKTGKRVQAFENVDSSTHAGALSPDGKILALSQTKYLGVNAQGFNRYFSWIELRDARTDKMIREICKREQPIIYSLKFTPNGKVLLAGMDHGKGLEWVRYDPATGKELPRRNFGPDVPPQVREDDITTIISTQKGLEAWRLDGPKPHVTLIALPAAVQFSGMTNDHKTLVFQKAAIKVPDANGNWVEKEPAVLIQWDLQTNKAVRTLEGATLSHMQIAPDGKSLLAAGHNGEILCWDLTTGKLRSRSGAPAGAVTTLAWSPDGHMLATNHLTLSGNSVEDTLRVWDVVTGQQRHQVNKVRGYQFAGDKLLIAKTVRDWRFLSLVKGEPPPPAKVGVDGPINAFLIAADAKTLAAIPNQNLPAWAGAPVPWQLHLWDLSARKQIGTWQAPFQVNSAMAFSPDGRYLAAVKPVADPPAEQKNSYKSWRSIFLWDVKKGAVARECTDARDAVMQLCFTRDGKTLVSGSHTGYVQIWDVASGKERFHFRPSAAEHFNFFLAVSPDGKTIAIGADNGIAFSLWDAASGKKLRDVHGHLDRARCLAFSPDGRSLASGSDDSTVLIWDVAALRK